MKTLPGEVGELVGVLTGGGHSYGSRPIVVQVAQLVGKPLYVIGLQSGSVVDHVVASGRNCSLADGLGNDEEVVPLAAGDVVIDNGARRGVGQLTALPEEEAVVDPLFHYDESETRPEENFNCYISLYGYVYNN